jgi:hypothetical protein
MRHVTGWLWRFQLFRWFVVSYCHFGLPGASWLAVETPFAVVLREWALREGHYEIANRMSAELRRLDG